MSRAVCKTDGQETRQVGYRTNLEYLTDELRRLDLLIHLRLLEGRGRASSNHLTQFKGLVLLEEEIVELLDAAFDAAVDENPAARPDPRTQTLVETLTQLEHQIQQRRAANPTGQTLLPLARLSELFHLTRFEEECVLACLAVEIDRKYEKLYAYLQDDVTRKKASVGLLAILATNLRGNMDEAFVRRMRLIIEFPFPDEEHRRRIWQVTFPPEAPLAGDVDLRLLASEIRLSGGSIRNIALSAAFYAAQDGKEIRMPHLLSAARREFQKMGLSWKEI